MVVRIDSSAPSYAGMVELADTLVLGTSASAWGFKSLSRYQFSPRRRAVKLTGLQPVDAGSTPAEDAMGR